MRRSRTQPLRRSVAVLDRRVRNDKNVAALLAGVDAIHKFRFLE